MERTHNLTRARDGFQKARERMAYGSWETGREEAAATRHPMPPLFIKNVFPITATPDMKSLSALQQGFRGRGRRDIRASCVCGAPLFGVPCSLPGGACGLRRQTPGIGSRSAIPKLEGGPGMRVLGGSERGEPLSSLMRSRTPTASFLFTRSTQWDL